MGILSLSDRCEYRSVQTSPALNLCGHFDELADHATIPPRIAEIVRGLWETPPRGGQGGGAGDRAIPRVARAPRDSRSARDARVSRRSRTRHRLRMALNRLALSLVSEADPVGEQRSTKEIAQWLEEAVDVQTR